MLFCCRQVAVVLATNMLLMLGSARSAEPSAYLVLRRPESFGSAHRAGHADGAIYDARASGYAYGWFGAAPRTHASRHFGYYRTYTQWRWW